MAVRKLRDLTKPELARIVHLQRITSRAWHDRKNPDDGVYNLTAAMEAKRVKLVAPKSAIWIGVLSLGVYVAACVWHVTLSLFQGLFS
jgi:hypothetical protein